CMQGTHFPYSF
nr:immunoglobulin light chain junction region [Macaca mulatta]MPN92994.1 immunoglobulin light chain junction region [Macaca mulatta]MPN93843.1 immunoglobulin light chain junction region [Macaca mulatta]MPN94683.1 immunoglobulin light chain junction region [Macaca mulatta]MPN95363.1 immunoglobulin light chain junction region [Macaca mulatta]